MTFVRPPFQSNNAYAAPNMWVWKVPSGIYGRDEVFNQRSPICTNAGWLSGAQKALCVEASIGHPNVLGALAYANAITAELVKSLPAWKQLHSSVQHAP